MQDFIFMQDKVTDFMCAGEELYRRQEFMGDGDRIG